MKRKRTRGAVEKKCNSNDFSTISDSQTLIPYFSNDIWSEILSWLSSTRLCSTMSRVCKTWYTMIRQPYFVETNLLGSKSSNYIIQNIYNVLSCIELYASYLETRRLKIGCLGVMHSTSQGLCIFNDRGSYFVINPVTGQRDKISHINGLISPHNEFSYSAVRDRRSGEVKLVLACLECSWVSSWYVRKIGTEDSWKTISKGNKFGQLDFPGISIAGFLIYVVRNHIVVLDVSLETIHVIRSPTYEVCPVTYLQMRTNVLSCISQNSGRIYIHILNDFIAGNWSIYKILDYGYVRGVSPEYHQFLGWIRNKEKSLSNSHEELFVRLDKSSITTLSAGSSSYRYSLSDDDWDYITCNLKTKRIIPLHGIDSSWKFVESGRVWVHTPAFFHGRKCKHKDVYSVPSNLV